MWIFLAAARAADVCTAWGDQATVDVPDIPVEQSSGVAAARDGSGRHYTHDDGGGDAALYLFDLDGEYLGTQFVDGAENVDWEDLASGPCPATVDADHCLWIADIGDNDETRDDVVLYVVPESDGPDVTAVRCPLTYPEGKRWDAEALLVAPDGVVRIVTKEDGEAHVFRVDEPACDGEAQTLAEEAEIVIEGKVTGGAVSDDGSMFVLRSLTQAWMWQTCSIDWGDTPTAITLTGQEQGEAIAFDEDGALLTTTEGDFRAWRLPCATTEALDCPKCGCKGSSSAFLLILPLAWRRRRSGR